ncbi:MAG: DnaJ domain-containing protein [Deltaproteobacteria bacterium]|nr:DnaJ domain-containing protein [Deltaproteobacteria bacterium]
MDTFETRLAEIDRAALERHLEALSGPCYEAELYRIIFPEVTLSTVDALTLYENHFLLFHVLYLLQENYYALGRYLHVHFMRTCLVPYPDEGLCRFYHDETGTFCGEACQDGRTCCPFHGEQIGDHELETLSLRCFYLDKINFSKLNSDNADVFINGTWEVMRFYPEYQESLVIMDLPESADIAMIKKKFKSLARQYHPDLSRQAPDRFNEINRAYRVLIKLRMLLPQ